MPFKKQIGTMHWRPTAKIELEHRAYFVRGTPSGSIVVVASEDGQISIINSDFETLSHNKIASKIRAICPHPSGHFFAFVDGESGSLVIQTLSGSKIAEITPPTLHAAASNWLKQGFDDCYFDDSGKFLWLVAPLNDDEVELTLVDAARWSDFHKTRLNDLFGTSTCSLGRSGDPDVMSLWMAAGQDGQQTYWLRRDSPTFCCEQDGDLSNTTPPVFSPNGSTFLVLNEINEIRKFDFSTLQKTGPPLKSPVEDDPFSESMCFLDDQSALVTTLNGRIFLVDVVKMKVREEIAIEGHEPRPVAEYYPSLKKESGLATDITWFAKVSDAVYFIFRRDGGVGLDDWEDTLLCCRAPN